MPRRLGLLATVVLGACGPSGPATPPSPSSASLPDTAALGREVPRLLRAGEIPGLAMAVVRNGRVVWTRGYGTLNDSAKQPVTPETVFEAASLSKPVFAYLVLRLADRGEFDLDRPLSRTLKYPRLAHDERYHRITARMVLSHATGLPNWGGERLTLRFEPGTEYSYSGEGFVYLQKTLERVTGKTLDQLARQEVFGPLGMSRSGYVWQDRFSGNAAYGRNWLWHVAPAHRYATGNAAASLLTTAPDYARFVAAVLTGRGLSPEMWRTYLMPGRETSPGIHMGLGIRVEEGPDGRIFYHSGNNGRRFTCYMTGDVAKGIGLVYFTNASNGTSLVDALSSPVLGHDRRARNRATFDRYDDPRLLAYRSIQHEAVDNGPAAGLARLQAVQADSTTRLSYDETLELGAFLTGRGLLQLSTEILERAVAAAPDSAEGYLALGRALESAGSIQPAIESYRRAQLLEGGEREAEEQIRWAEERLAAKSHSVSLSEEALRRYEGHYLEGRTVRFREGRLYYESSARPTSPLAPMGEDLFEVEADPFVRVRFVVEGETGPSGRLVEIYSDGSTEELKRLSP